MNRYGRVYNVVAFKSSVEGLYFAQVHNITGTRVVHQTGLYDSSKWAMSAANEWAENSASKIAKTLHTETRE